MFDTTVNDPVSLKTIAPGKCFRLLSNPRTVWMRSQHPKERGSETLCLDLGSGNAAWLEIGTKVEPWYGRLFHGPSKEYVDDVLSKC